MYLDPCGAWVSCTYFVVSYPPAPSHLLCYTPLLQTDAVVGRKTHAGTRAVSLCHTPKCKQAVALDYETSVTTDMGAIAANGQDIQLNI